MMRQFGYCPAKTALDAIESTDSMEGVEAVEGKTRDANAKQRYLAAKASLCLLTRPRLPSTKAQSLFYRRTEKQKRNGLLADAIVVELDALGERDEGESKKKFWVRGERWLRLTTDRQG
jgi:hypothetical protein